MKQNKSNKIIIGLLLGALSSSAMAAGTCNNSTNAQQAAQTAIDNARNAVQSATASGGGLLPIPPDLSSCLGSLSGFNLSFLGGSMPNLNVCSMLRQQFNQTIGSQLSSITNGLGQASGGMVSGSFNNSGKIGGSFSGFGQNGSVSTPTSSLF